MKVPYSEYLIVVGVILVLSGVIKKILKVKRKTLVDERELIALAKMQPEVYKGISFVRLSNLPRDQKQVISKTEIKKIKIKTESSLLTDCVQYLDYEKWYESIRATQLASVRLVKQPS